MMSERAICCSEGMRRNGRHHDVLASVVPECQILLSGTSKAEPSVAELRGVSIHGFDARSRVRRILADVQERGDELDCYGRDK